MTDKHTKRVNQYYNDLLEERDDLFKNIERLISTANLQVQKMSRSQTTLTENEAIFTYLTKVLLVFCELNHSALNCLDTVNPPFSVEADLHSSHHQNVNSNIQELQNCVKTEQSNSTASLDFSKHLPNSQSISNVKKSLDNTTFPNNPENTVSTNDTQKTVLNNVPAVTSVQNTDTIGNATISNPRFSTLSTLECLETVTLPVSGVADSHCRHQQQNFSSNVQELQDYLKLDQSHISTGLTSFPFSKQGPKVSNSQIQNNSYVRKPLDDTTLKAICSTFLNNSEQTIPTSDTENAVSSSAQAASSIQNNDTKSGSLIHQVSNSSAFSCVESDVFSTISSGTYAHPLKKIHPPTEIPDQYDSSDLEQVKENMRYISRKMGFDSEGFAQISSQYDKSSTKIDYRFEQPVRDVTQQPEEETIPECSTVSVPENTERLNNENEAIVHQNTSSLLNNQYIGEPLISTGAIRKQTATPEDLIEFSTSSDSESSKKVASWLTDNAQAKKIFYDGSDTSQNVHTNKPSAVEKLDQIKRFDRNEEARERARADMPNLKLIPVETPQVIKNDLNSVDVLLDKAKKPKVKDLNKEIVVYEIKKPDAPQMDAVCVFSHIVSPNEFYLQFVNDVNGDHLDQVSTKLDEKFSKTKSKFRSKQEAADTLGSFCYGYIWAERKAWYRLQVLDWKLDNVSDDVEVQSVDYGFKCTTLYEYLRELTVDLAHIPMLAIKCHFPLLYPPGSTYSNRLTQWSIGTVEALYDIANLSRDLTQVSEDIALFQIVFAEQDGDSVAVDLAYFSEPDVDTLGQLLVDMGLATEIMDEYEQNPELGDFLEDIDQLEKADNLNEFLLGYDARDEARICQFTRKDGSCYKGKHCKLEHILLKDGYTTDKKAIFYTAINDLILPVKGETVQVLVTKYIDSCTYLVQMIRNPVEKSPTHIIMDKVISDLMDAMNHPKIVAKYVPFKVFPSIGEIILAYHPFAKKWVRSAVTERDNGEDAIIEVYSVDFGDEFSVNIKNARLMQEEFMHVPFQVIQIYLENFRDRRCDTKQGKKFFDKHIGFKNFLACIKSNEPPFKVQLTTFKHRDIGPTLVKEGLAEKRTVDHFITEDKDKRRHCDLE